MRMDLYWIDGPWQGKLAIAPRPRGADWLKDDIAAWQRAGLNTAVSLLTPEEEKHLDLRDEARAVPGLGMMFISFPIPDREVPSSQTEFAALLDKIDRDLTAGRNVILHCRAGIGRSGLVAACLLVMKGVSPEEAVKKVSAARGVSVPETKEQRNWIDQYAATLAAAK
jgi:protein-tyrosine phosphatase